MSSLPMRRAVAAALVATVSVAPLACSDDRPTTRSTTSSAPEDIIAPAAEVTAGLRDLVRIADEIVAAGNDAARARAAVERLEPVWERVEGAVRKNDLDTYLQVEEDLVLLGKAANGDTATAARGATDLSSQVDAYLATYSG